MLNIQGRVNIILISFFHIKTIIYLSTFLHLLAMQRRAGCRDREWISFRDTGKEQKNKK